MPSYINHKYYWCGAPYSFGISYDVCGAWYDGL